MNSYSFRCLENFQFLVHWTYNPGTTTIPFEVPLTSKSSRPLYDSYHGVFISIQYISKVELRRGMLGKPVVKQMEFIVEGLSNLYDIFCGVVENSWYALCRGREVLNEDWGRGKGCLSGKFFAEFVRFVISRIVYSMIWYQTEYLH